MKVNRKRDNIKQYGFPQEEWILSGSFLVPGYANTYTEPGMRSFNWVSKGEERALESSWGGPISRERRAKKGRYSLSNRPGSWLEKKKARAGGRNTHVVRHRAARRKTNLLPKGRAVAESPLCVRLGVFYSVRGEDFTKKKKMPSRAGERMLCAGRRTEHEKKLRIQVRRRE